MKGVSYEKLFSLILAVTLMSSMFITANAASNTSPATVTDNNNLIILNDSELLAKADTAVEAMVGEAATYGFFISLKNRQLRGQYYYGDVPFLVDSVKGPMAVGPKITFKTKTTANAKLDFGITKDEIKAHFGVSFTKEEELERVYQFDPIPVGKYLTYKAYVNYSVYDFEVYSLGIYQGMSCYWVPVGIVVEHNLS